MNNFSEFPRIFRKLWEVSTIYSEIMINFADMNRLTTTIYRYTEDLPELEESNFFHSRKLFEICKAASHQKPYMVVTTDETGRVVGHLLGIVRYRTLILPPFLIVHCRILGEGVYAEDCPYSKEERFDEMLRVLTQSLNSKTLYIEVSNLGQKMFGYKQLRQQGFYPVNWMSIHNSLHSHAPEERVTDKLLKRINNVHARGVTTTIVSRESDFQAFMKVLRKHHILKPKRYIPDDSFFRQIAEGGHGQLFVTKYHDKVIGCSACVYSEDDAYLWYSAFLRKTYMTLHPDDVIIWDTMKDAYERGCQHMRFMDVGLPFRKNPFREFILRFGGKEQSTYRWFRFSIKWVNALLAWLYRE